jgi:hypothetical protein
LSDLPKHPVRERLGAGIPLLNLHIPVPLSVAVVAWGRGGCSEPRPVRRLQRKQPLYRVEIAICRLRHRHRSIRYGSRRIHRSTRLCAFAGWRIAFRFEAIYTAKAGFPISDSFDPIHREKSMCLSCPFGQTDGCRFRCPGRGRRGSLCREAGSRRAAGPGGAPQRHAGRGFTRQEQASVMRHASDCCRFSGDALMSWLDSPQLEATRWSGRQYLVSEWCSSALPCWRSRASHRISSPAPA